MDVVGQLRKKFPDLVDGPNGEYHANCPQCLSRVGKPDTKQKLYINPTKYNAKVKKRGSFFCQRCNFRGWGLDALGITDNVDTSKVIELKTLGKKLQERLRENAIFEFPEGFSQDFSNPNFGKAAYHYLTKVRGLTPDKIVYYKLGYCSNGKYKNCVILPVFEQGNLVYFVARNIYRKMYMNPPKPNRAVLFNFTEQKEIVLTEGIFDAIAAGYGGVALLGKYLKEEQYNTIVQAQPKKVYIMLDIDAKKEAVEIAKKLAKGVPNVFLVSTGQYKDAGEMPREKIKEALENAFPASLNGMMRYLCA